MICLDASLVASAFLPEGDMSVRAEECIARWLTDGVGLMAPDLWAYEVVSIVFKAVVRGRLPVDHGPVVLAQMLDFPITLVRPSSYARAYALAIAYKLPVPYDAHYLAVAEAEGIEFWTGDEQLYNRVHAALPWVHWLGETG